MAIGHSSSVVTSGLIYYYDQSNVKSYAGPAIQNLAKAIPFNNNSNTGISIVGVNETEEIPTLGLTPIVSTTIQNNYNVYTPNSADCCPSPIGGWGNFTVTTSTQYTYAIVYKCVSGYTHPNFMYRYEFTTSTSGTLVTEGGVHNTNNRTHLGNGWFWAWNTFTTAPTTTWINYAGAFYYRYSTTSDKLSIAKVLITPGNYTSLHPKYWPNQSSTRASTQVLYDFIGNASNTVYNLTYANDGAFSFNGSTGYLSFPSTTQFGNTNFSIEFVLKVNAASSMHGVVLWAGTGPFNASGKGIEIRFQGNLFEYTIADGVGSGIRMQYTFPNIVDGNFRHFTITQNFAGTANLYVNSVSVATQSYAGEVAYADTYTFQIGRGNDGYLNGTIPMFKLYNKALSVTEVQQNFAAVRGRYGI